MANRTGIGKSLVWVFFERCSAQGLSFVLTLVLARLLDPDAYGALAIIAVFIELANMLSQGGLSTALIQKKEVDETDYSSVFFISTAIAALLYLLLFFLSDPIAAYYKNPLLKNALRVLGLSLIASPFVTVQSAVVSRNLQFKKTFISNTLSSLLAGVVGIFLAYSGFGLWALVFNQLTSKFAGLLISLCLIPWRPKPSFSVHRFISLISYSWKLLLVGITDTLYSNISTLLIGKLYNSSELGYYNRAMSIPSMLMDVVNSTVNTVVLPAMAQDQDNKKHLVSITQISITATCLVTFPLMGGIIVIAQPLVLILLTERWLPCVPYLQLACLTYAFWPIHTLNAQAIKAIGRSDIVLKQEIIKKAIGLALLCIAVQISPLAILISLAFQSLINIFICSYPNKGLIGYGFKSQLVDLAPILAATLIMLFVVYCTGQLPLSPFPLLCCQIVIGILSYFGVVFLFHVPVAGFLLSLLKNNHNS